MTYSPNFALEALRGVLTIAGWYVLFYLRRIARKYNGEIAISDRDGTFVLSVMLFRK